MRILKSIPIVVMKDGVKESSLNRSRQHDLPTPESPISSSLIYRARAGSVSKRVLGTPIHFHPGDRAQERQLPARHHRGLRFWLALGVGEPAGGARPSLVVPGNHSCDCSTWQRMSWFACANGRWVNVKDLRSGRLGGKVVS